MEGFLDALYEYAQETRITSYLDRWKYQRATDALEEDWEAFRATLTEEQDKKLNALLMRENKVTYLEDRAVFSCALSIGVGLGRL